MEENQFVRMGFECPISVFIQAYTGEKNVELAKRHIIENDCFFVGGVTVAEETLDFMLAGDAWVECMSIQELPNVSALEVTCVHANREINFECDVCEMVEFLPAIYYFAKQP